MSDSLRDELLNAMSEAKGTQEQPTEVEAVTVEEPTETIVDPVEAVEVVEEDKYLNPPQGLKQEIKEKWTSLDKQIREEWTRREEDVHKMFTSREGELQLGKDMKEVISPYMPVIQAEGGNPVAAVQSLLNTAYVLRTAPPAQKAQLIKQIINDYGVDMTLLTQEQEYQDPLIANLQKEIQTLKTQSDPNNLRKLLQEQQERDSIMSEVNAFAANPANVHFEKVRHLMSPLLANGQAKDLQEAYEMSCWSVPEIRNDLLAKQVQAEAEKKRAEISKKQTASSSISGSPASSSSNSTQANQSSSIADTIRAAMREQQSKI